MRSSSRKAIAIVLRVLLCALFLFSAVAKLMGINQFELYIFSYGLLSLNLSFVAARLCIGAELVLAWLIATHWHPRTERLLTLLTLTGFSMVLCYAAIVGRDDSCQCFGQAVSMSPVQSLLKNAVLLALALLYFRLSPGAGQGRRWHVWATLAAGAVLLAAPFAVSVPDSWAFGPSEQRYGAAALDDAMGEGGAMEGYRLTEGRHLVAFVTPGCPYCKMARQKIDAIVARHKIDASKAVYVEPSDIGAGLFLQVTFGSRPLVVLIDGGKVVATFHYRNISEKQVAGFLAKNE